MIKPLNEVYIGVLVAFVVSSVYDAFYSNSIIGIKLPAIGCFLVSLGLIIAHEVSRDRVNQEISEEILLPGECNASQVRNEIREAWQKVSTKMNLLIAFSLVIFCSGHWIIAH